ncbi:MAG: response regulator, partial [Thermoguttaceae bacterium]
MPGMSGFGLAERIQRDPELSGTVLLMLSSGEGPGDMARCRLLNISAHLMKPIKQSELLHSMTLALGIGSKNRPRTASSAVGPLPLLRVLQAEDSLTNQRLAVATLQRLGHTVEVAESGNVALDKLATEHFDVVLMDVRMPDMDGLEATRIVRARERLAGGHVPIVALTANAMQGDRDLCLEAGMDSYMTKPMQVTQLVAAISEALGHVDPAGNEEGARPVSQDIVEPFAAAGQQRTGCVAGIRPGLSDESWPSDERASAVGGRSAGGPVDWELARQQAYGDEQVLFDLASNFLQESERYLVQLREASARGDARSASLAAHTLKGQLAIFGAREAEEVALGIE